MSYQVQWPKAEYHDVLPNLYIGGHVWEEDGTTKDSRHSKISEDSSWNYVVSAYVSDFNTSWPQCDQRLVLFRDTEEGLEDKIWDRIRSVVDEVVSRWWEGQKVLVRCQAGYNRSGMMMSLILMRLGYSANEAIAHVRWRRGQDVLTNQAFEHYVRDHENEYCEPAARTATEAWANSIARQASALLK